MTREPNAAVNPKALHIIRKVAALGVAAMEQHGAPLRDMRRSMMLAAPQAVAGRIRRSNWPYRV